jgi:hypothetical protein
VSIFVSNDFRQNLCWPGHRRLALIRARIGIDPRQLRRRSPHIAKLEDALRDPRVSHLNPQSLIDEPDDPET